MSSDPQAQHCHLEPNDWLGLILKWLGVVEGERKISSTTTAVTSRALLRHEEIWKLVAGAIETGRKRGQMVTFYPKQPHPERLKRT